MKRIIKPHGGLKAITTEIAAILLALASIPIASAQTNNTRTGTNAGTNFFTSSGDDNTADGFSALRSNTSGLRNTAVGSVALKTNTVGNYNTAVGYGTLTVSTA